MINLYFVVLNVFDFLQLIKCSNNSTKRALNDDYYINYDYDIPNNSKVNLLLPNPETLDSKYTIDVLPNVELPDDSLADTDLKDHDFIDNLMYVYYGTNNSKNIVNYSTEIIIISSVLNCAAQLLTIAFLLFKKNLNGRKDMKNMFLHTLVALWLSNLLFMIGIYAIKSPLKCLLVALMLHYLHLLAAFWMFLYCYYISQRFTSIVLQKRYFILIGYGLPLIFSISSYLITPYSFETKRFCFLSVQKGMILNFMLPVSILLILTTIYSLNGIRKINIELTKFDFNHSFESINISRNSDIDNSDHEKANDDEIISLKESKICLKLLCIIQTCYDIVWFVVVLALENNNDNTTMSIVYAVISLLLNWYIFIRVKLFLPNSAAMNRTTDDILIISCSEQAKLTSSDGNLIITRDSSDNIPLLLGGTENCTELKELRVDYISTISN